MSELLPGERLNRERCVTGSRWLVRDSETSTLVYSVYICAWSPSGRYVQCLDDEGRYFWLDVDQGALPLLLEWLPN